MQKLIEILNSLPEFEELVAQLEGGRCPLAVSGLSGVHRAHIAAGLRKTTGRPVVLLCGDENDGRRLQADLSAFTGEEVRLLAGREFVFHDATASRQWEHRRLSLLHALRRGEITLLVATAEALLQRTIPPQVLDRTCITLRMEGQYRLEELAERLTAAGYSRCEQVEGPGQFSLRGGILDVYSPEAEAPVRAEFWGDEMDSMGVFDPVTQRRVRSVEEAVLLPAAETLPQLAPGGVLGLCEAIEREKLRLERAAKRKSGDGSRELQALWNTMEADSRRLAELASADFPAADRYMDLIYPDFACGADYLPGDACVLWAESGRCMEAARHFLWRAEQDLTTLAEAGAVRGKLRCCLEPEELARRLAERCPNLYLDSFLTSKYPVPPKELVTFSCRQLPGFGSSPETAVSDLRYYQNKGVASVVLCRTEGRAGHLAELFREQGLRVSLDLRLSALPDPGTTALALGGLSGGMEYSGFAVITEENTPVARKRAPAKRRRTSDSSRQKLQSYTDLNPGDLVVHEQYGIGRFLALATLEMDGVQKDYLRLAYAGTDTLYIPITQLDQVSKYIGGGENPDGTPKAKLTRLGGGDWTRARSRAKKATREMAKELIQLYAQRQRRPGHAFHPDDPWQREFEDQFEFQETEDQLRCIREIKADMERPVPMDRLLCGDVGYGKTEIAMRAIMKCVLEGKQAAMLVPTTVLASQHFQTVQRRFRSFPVRVRMLTRHQNSRASRQILHELEEGLVDILIGTHRLLQSNIKFRDLGLLVIDEEQRFGVSHKERLKEMASQVDVLTLSATPIPRTLNMALSGLRDMSTIDEPPQDRQPVQTYVLEHDWGILTDAIRREIGRGGQVYYLHNRIDTIEKTTATLRAMLDDEEIVIETAHGRMSQDRIADVMARMVDGEIQILVCTTIIETGIDIPNVNTLIIEDADRMGLSQLHQIRGRVGRSPRRAFAYLTYRQGKVLSEVATRRLSAVREFAAFGAGFKIAMRDLEIRGAGNLLGREQSGNLLSVGYDLYLKLLEEAVLEEKGETPPEERRVTADLTVHALIPDSYVPSSGQRMDLYRRIAHIRGESDADDLVDEMIDRYGDPPRPVNNLISVALLRAEAAGLGIRDIVQRDRELRLILREVSVPQLVRLSEQPAWRKRVTFGEDRKGQPMITLLLRRAEDPLAAARRLLADYRAALPEPDGSAGPA